MLLRRYLPLPGIEGPFRADTLFCRQRQEDVLPVRTVDGAAGIGCGYYGASNDITITSGTVMATGGENAAGIGSGEGGSCGAITISGGTVTATAVKWAAGIGGGNMNGASGTITITSGVTQVTATKGSDWLDSIGKGDGGEIITVIIEDYDKVIQN